MNWYFLFIQMLGFLAWILLVYSYYRENTNKILIFQILSTVLFCIHYYLLGAYSGLLICIYEVLRDYSYYKTDKDNYIFIGSAVVYAVSAVITYTSVLDLFRYLAIMIDGVFLTKKRKVVVFGAIITYVMWFIYDMYARSYSGAITDGILITSNILILVFNIDIFGGRNVKKLCNK